MVQGKSRTHPKSSCSNVAAVSGAAVEGKGPRAGAHNPAQGSGFWVQGIGFRVHDLGFMV